MKKCFICNINKEINDFYKHSGMSDGRLNKCKECCKKQSKIRESQLRQNPEWVEKEKVRSREKYYRLEYKDLYKPSHENKKRRIEIYNNKYPEKLKARIKCNRLKLDKGFNNHHWSYNEEHYMDVIVLSIKNHNLIHRYLKYDPFSFYYKTEDGFLLDTKEKHLNYIETLINKP